MAKRTLTTGKGAANVATVVNQRSTLVTIRVVKAGLKPKAGTYQLVGGEMKEVALTVADYRGSPAERTSIGGLEAIDGVTMLAVPDLMSSYQSGELDLEGVQAVQRAMYEFCERNKYCFAILDPPPDLSPQAVKEWRLSANYDSKYAALYYPWIKVADMTGRAGHPQPTGRQLHSQLPGTRHPRMGRAHAVQRSRLALCERSSLVQHDRRVDRAGHAVGGL
jgi:phage tail sheath protein FI